MQPMKRSHLSLAGILCAMFVSCMTRTIPAAGELESWTGTIREVGTAPEIRILLKEIKSNQEWELQGNLRPELHRLLNMRVTVWGNRLKKGILYEEIEVLRYDIEDVGGANKPEIGLIDRKNDELILKREGKSELKLSGEIRDQLLGHIGSKAWIIGYMQGDSFRVYQFGILRPEKPAQEWFDFE